MIKIKQNDQLKAVLSFLPTLLISGLLFGLVALASRADNQKWKSENLVLTDGKNKITLKVDLAITEHQRARGLMFRSKLAANEGMLFDFGAPQTISLWMKNVSIPLEAACFDEKGRLVETFMMQPCKTDPCPIYSSQSTEVRYLIEWTPGLLQTQKLTPGTTRIQDLKKLQKSTLSQKTDALL